MSARKGQPVGLTTSVSDCCLPCMLMLAARRPVLVFLAEPPQLCLTVACDPIQRLRILIQCRMQLSKLSGHSSLRSPRPGLAPQLARIAQLGHPEPTTLECTLATHEPCMTHTQDADLLLPVDKRFRIQLWIASRVHFFCQIRIQCCNGLAYT